tara:strand:+ start:399 stop:695 length:297 start_codon:yes stop_codon:yes gene_type:complete
MELIKNKYFFWGIFTGLLWIIFGVITIIFFLSDTSLESSLITLYQQNKLGGLISIASLINLPIFFLALRKNKMSFATGLVTLSIAMVLVITYLKINTS